jgi:WD40 repeat protein
MVPRKITNNKKSSNTAKYKAQSSSKKGKTNGSFTVFKTVATVFVVFLLLFLATETFGVATLSSMSDSVKSFVASLKSGEGYPYQISSSSVKNIDMMSNNVFLLTDSATISLDSTAKEVAKINHTYASPAMSIQGGRAVVYDRGGYRYMVQSRTEKLFEGETKHKILTCDMGKSGNIAVVTLEKDSCGVVTVYSNKFTKTQFKWACYSEKIVDVALSDNGKYLAVAAISAKDGEVFSKVYVFDFNYSKAVAVFDYPKTSVFDVEFSSRDTIIVMGDNLRNVIKNKTQRQEDVSFETSTLMRYSMSESGTNAVLLSEYGSANKNILKVYNKSGKEVFSKKIESAVKNIYCNANTVGVLLDDKLVMYDINGNEKEKIKSKKDSIDVLFYGRDTYIYAIGEIIKCP